MISWLALANNIQIICEFNMFNDLLQMLINDFVFIRYAHDIHNYPRQPPSNLAIVHPYAPLWVLFNVLVRILINESHASASGQPPHPQHDPFPKWDSWVFFNDLLRLAFKTYY